LPLLKDQVYDIKIQPLMHLYRTFQDDRIEGRTCFRVVRTAFARPPLANSYPEPFFETAVILHYF